MFFEGIILKDALRNVTIILWQLLTASCFNGTSFGFSLLA